MPTLKEVENRADLAKRRAMRPNRKSAPITQQVVQDYYKDPRAEFKDVIIPKRLGKKAEGKVFVYRSPLDNPDVLRNKGYEPVMEPPKEAGGTPVQAAYEGDPVWAIDSETYYMRHAVSAKIARDQTLGQLKGGGARGLVDERDQEY